MFGQIHQIAISEIWYPERTDRSESGLGDIEFLKNSIHNSGLINPIIVSIESAGECKYQLVSGFRRLHACVQLGLTTISARIAEELSKSQLAIVQLVENVTRHDITPKERVESIDKIHSLFCAENPEWTTQQTANAIGLSVKRTSTCLNLASAVNAGEIKLDNATSIAGAAGKLGAARKRQANSIVAGAIGALRGSPVLEETEKELPLLNASFLDWKGDGVLYNFIHADFPYGRAVGKLAVAEYEESREIFFELLDHLLVFGKKNFVAPDATVMLWCTENYREEIQKVAKKHKWIMYPWPLIWVKQVTVGVTPDPLRYPRRNYELAYILRIGDPRVVRIGPAAVQAPIQPNDLLGHSAKPISVLSALMSTYVDGMTTFLDPTCGSGTAIAAAEYLGAGKILGIEILKQNYDMSCDTVRNARLISS